MCFGIKNGMIIFYLSSVPNPQLSYSVGFVKTKLPIQCFHLTFLWCAAELLKLYCTYKSPGNHVNRYFG